LASLVGHLPVSQAGSAFPGAPLHLADPASLEDLLLSTLALRLDMVALRRSLQDQGMVGRLMTGLLDGEFLHRVNSTRHWM